MSSQTNHHRSYTLSREQIPPVVIEELDEIERINLKEKIKKELVRQNAVIVSHYYSFWQMKPEVVYLTHWIWPALDMNQKQKH